jgi:hypothetical protein
MHGVEIRGASADAGDVRRPRGAVRPSRRVDRARLLSAAIDYARGRGVRLLEAYPVDKPTRSHDDFMFFGSRTLYERGGFREIVRRSPTRVVMRRALRPHASELVRKRDSAERNPALGSPPSAGQIPEGARCRGRNCVLDYEADNVRRRNPPWCS